MNDILPSEPKSQASFAKKLFAVSPSGLFKLLIACLIVGFVLAVLEIDPRRVWVDFFGTITDAWATGWDMISGAVDYLILGAIIVVPVFILLRLLNATSKK